MIETVSFIRLSGGYDESALSCGIHFMIDLIAAQTHSDPSMGVIVFNTLLLLARWLHIVCTTLLVGGTLFYEMVVPIAIDDLKPEQQLAIFARARWVFRRIVWFSAGMFVLTGISSTARHWQAYAHPEQMAAAFIKTSEVATTQPATQPVMVAPPVGALRPVWWWMAHAGTGLIAIVIALTLTTVRTPPSHPVRWMRLNLVILMIVIFLASATRHVRIAATEPRPAPQASAMDN